jgi:hypothetical protein
MRSWNGAAIYGGHDGADEARSGTPHVQDRRHAGGEIDGQVVPSFQMRVHVRQTRGQARLVVPIDHSRVHGHRKVRRAAKVAQINRPRKACRILTFSMTSRRASRASLRPTRPLTKFKRRRSCRRRPTRGQAAPRPSIPTRCWYRPICRAAAEPTRDGAFGISGREVGARGSQASADDDAALAAE